MTDAEIPPHERVAEAFMAHKGFPDAEPFLVEKLEGRPTWYFYYQVDSGRLELEVCWAAATGWETTVTSFTLTD